MLREGRRVYARVEGPEYLSDEELLLRAKDCKHCGMGARNGHRQGARRCPGCQQLCSSHDTGRVTVGAGDAQSGR